MMLKGLMLKAVVFGIICLFVGTCITQALRFDTHPEEYTTEEHPNTNQISDENSIICGYVYDTETGYPLTNVNVRQHWEDSEGNYGYNYTITNQTGYYHFNTAAVDFNLYFSIQNYFSEYSPWESIGENEVFWYNISLILYPPVTVWIHGYITDDTSGEPIEGANIYLYWYDTEDHSWHNNTISNSSGYYILGSIPGMTYLNVYRDGYFNYNSDYFYTENNSIIWFNISLIPYPPVSALVCGYITDVGNGAPIVDADIYLSCETEYGYFSNNTRTNGVGFYSLGTIPGTVHISVNKQDYTYTYSENYIINEYETLWINLSMEFEPEVTSLVKGYVVDNETHAAVRNAFVQYDWTDDIGHFYSDYTFTDQKGFYTIEVPDGTLQFLITANGYTNQMIPWFEIDEFANLWLNTTVSPVITAMFTKPQPGIYIRNASRFPILTKFATRLFPKFKPLIIGPLEITVNVTKSAMGCNRVDFYIDGIYRWTDSEGPFTYYWNEKGFSKHMIRAIAYDNAGPCTFETIMVRKIV